MVSITLSIPEEVHKLMRKFPEVNWSGLVRACITERAKILAIKEEMQRQFGKEKEFNEWAVNLVREGRKN
ncbi:MAG: hypothetical protein KKA64_01730 [Nanoarchaeota archaeon]|nr:hypothetical protein [Nanoarchaeota archaeon]